MRKVFSLILIMTMMFAGAMKADARNLPLEEIKSNIAKQAVVESAKYTDAELTATVTTLPFASVNIPEGKVTYSVQLLQEKFMSRALVKVTIYVNGKAEKVFNAPIWVKAYKNVLVATEDIPREQAITFKSVRVKKVDCSNYVEYALTGDTLSHDVIAKKYFKTGEVIDKRFVKLRPDVQRNSDVQAYFKTNGLTVSVSAVALSDGMYGDYVAVQSRDYKKVYRGKVVGENKIEIDI